ncbi:unnamed protein product [Cercopithifilaria johnstoni]|uniref:Protein amnionless n=1 Tax=Cercopithifilaria johnstoni TaxID=2874296 RepID=A0A8J2MQG5_9BILA|nr:unnamed protein product [Cercopithifilaria johnstoni]
MLRNIFELILLILPISNIQCLNYIFRRTNILDKMEYWKNNIIPCENDQINFDDEKITTVLIDNRLHSQKINLPKNGILFFGEMMEMGKLGSWQCKRRKNAEEVYFEQSPSLGFYNGSNWIVSKNGIKWHPALHALQVPSSQDTAIIPSYSGTRILLEDFVIVGALTLAGQVENNDTFNDLFLRSIEGQFQFDLALKLKSIRGINSIHYQLPKFKNTVAIMDFHPAKHNAGQFNSNLEAEKLALICSYQQCQPIVRKCNRPFRPIGHCCEICGSMLRFRTTVFNFNKFQNEVENYKRGNRIIMEYDLDIASLRIDHNDLLPQYQIVILARESAKRPFDEQIYHTVLKDVAGFVQNNFEISHSMAMAEIEEIISVNFHSSIKGGLVLALISSFAIGAIIIGVILTVRRKFNFPIFLRLSNQDSIYEAVHWRGARTEEDELELLRNNESTTLNTVTNDIQNYSMKSASEYCSTFENIAFDEETADDNNEK